MDINSEIVEKQIDRLLYSIEAEGRPVIDKPAKKAWVKEKLRKGFSLQVIYQALRTNNYDFITAGAFLDNMAKGKEEADKAMVEIKAMKAEKEKKEKAEKKNAHLSYIITAYMVSIIGFFIAYVIQKNLGETIGILDEGNPLGGFLHTFTKAGWIVGITGAAVGTLLVALMLADYFKGRSKKQEAEDIAEKRKEKETQTTAEKLRKMEAELAEHEQGQQQPKT
ncbi:MAG: hypothetical protein ABIB71_04245 [Candidatus Woesearchaeota archaeon]